MKIVPCFLLMAVAATWIQAADLPNPVEQQERIAAAFVIALGRIPAPDEIEHWARKGSPSVAELIAGQRERLQSDAGARHATALRAWQDAFGCEPRAGEISEDSTVASESARLRSQPQGAETAAAESIMRSAGGVATYAELMWRHIQRLADNPAEYEKVIQRAYQFLLHRTAYSPEIEYWKSRGTLSYALLVGCIDDWARRNQPGLTVTSGTATVSVNCVFLTTVRLSPAVAAEAREAAGLGSESDRQSPAASGHHLVAPGAAGIVTGGGIHFVAVGAPGLVAAIDQDR